MWVQAGFDLAEFWQQTPRHFQIAMQGARKRLEAERTAAVRQAWETAAFTAATQRPGGLKPLAHYLPRFGTKPSPGELADRLMALSAGGRFLRVKQIRSG
jgi:hypothetical protein